MTNAMRLQAVAFLAVWLLASFQPSNAQSIFPREPATPQEVAAMRLDDGFSALLTNNGKLRGVQIPKGDPNLPIMESPVPPAEGRVQPPIRQGNTTETPPNATQTPPTKVPASFIVQVASRPAAEAMGREAATTASSQEAAHARAQVMAEAVVSQVDRVAAAANVRDKVAWTYTHALSGFLLKGPTPNELRALVDDPVVVAIWPNKRLNLATYSTPEYLGLEGPSTTWGLANGKAPRVKQRKPHTAMKNNYRDEAHDDGYIASYRGRDDHKDSHRHTQQSDDRQEHNGYANSGGYERIDGGAHERMDPHERHYDSYETTDDYMRGFDADRGNSPGHDDRQFLWNELGGVLGPRGAGEDVVVGVLDSGLWLPDHPSFADKDYWATAQGNSGQSYTPLSKWRGTCQPSADSSTFECNNKVIGCRWYNTLGEVRNDIAGCGDKDGHGSHTASTAAGNYGAQAPYTPPGALLSGMAPRARIAVYKVCFDDAAGNNGCLYSDIVAAYDDAIKDGVDVINYSVGNGEFPGVIDMAQFNTAAAGIFVAAAAGNSGPDYYTAENLSPWVTTVAASYQARRVISVVNLGDGTSVEGATNPNHGRIGPAPIIYGADAAAVGVLPNKAGACVAKSLDAKLVRGAIVVCNYTSTFGAMYAEVQRAGGIAVIMARPTPDDVYEFPSSFPYIMLGPKEGEFVVRYSRTGTQGVPTAVIGAADFTYDNTAPQMASFSSRGPAVQGANQRVLKPDITAPGVNIVAAFSPMAGSLYATLMGTSMSSPHIAGIAALLKQRHPSWSPMAIKSAIMGTAYQLTRTGKSGQPFGNPFEYGAGHVDAPAALYPGLVVDSNVANWKAFLCSLVDPLKCNSIQVKTTQAQATRSRRPEWAGRGSGSERNDQCARVDDLNTPSISGIVAGAMRVKRTFTAMLGSGAGSAPVRFEASAETLPGSCFNIDVWPRRFEVSDGDSVDVWITIAAGDDTSLGNPQTGEIVWRSNQGHHVTMPVGVTFSAFTAPKAIYWSLPASVNGILSSTINIHSSRHQRVTVQASMQPPDIMSGVVKGTKASDAAVFFFTLPPQSMGVARLYDADYPKGTDLDLHLYQKQADGEYIRVAISESFTSDEMVTFDKPGDYAFVVYLYRGQPPLDVHLYVNKLALGGAQPPPSILTASPAQLRMMPPDPCGAQISLTATGLNATTGNGLPNRYLGMVLYTDSTSGRLMEYSWVFAQ